MKRHKQQSSGKSPQTHTHKHHGTSGDPARRRGGTRTRLFKVALRVTPLRTGLSGAAARSAPGLAARLCRCPATPGGARPDPALPPGRTDTPWPARRAPHLATLPAGCQGNYGPPRDQTSSAVRAWGVLTGACAAGGGRGRGFLRGASAVKRMYREPGLVRACWELRWRGCRARWAAAERPGAEASSSAGRSFNAC